MIESGFLQMKMNEWIPHYHVPCTQGTPNFNVACTYWHWGWSLDGDKVTLTSYSTVLFISIAAEMEASLHPYRTGTTLCVPNPSFSHEAQHTLSLNCGEPVQKYIMAACGRGLGGVVPFELWRRFYYPNIRDQLVARVIHWLPTSRVFSNGEISNEWPCVRHNYAHTVW